LRLPEEEEAFIRSNNVAHFADAHVAAGIEAREPAVFGYVPLDIFFPKRAATPNPL